MRDRASPRMISGTPTMWRPPGIPGKGGSSWVMASPATTSATAVRFHARKVRSLAKVKRASGSVPSSCLLSSRIACLADQEHEHAVLLAGGKQLVAGVLGPGGDVGLAIAEYFHGHPAGDQADADVPGGVQQFPDGRDVVDGEAGPHHPRCQRDHPG